MKTGLIGCLTVWFVATGMASAQTPESLDTPTMLAAYGEKSDQAATQPPGSLPAPTPLTTGEEKKADKTDSVTLPTVSAADGTPVPEEAPDGVGHGERFWVDVEYLLWRLKPMRLPPLVTTGPIQGQGIIGQPGTIVLFGDGAPQDTEWRSGIRVNAGMYLDCDQCWNLEVGGFLFPQKDNTQVFGSNLCAFLARPFFSLNTCQEVSEITSQTGLSQGATTVSTPSRFWGADVNLSKKICCGCCYRVDLLGGFRYLELDEAVEIDEFIKVASGTLPPQFQQFQQFAGDTIQVRDRFATRNQFYGGQLGVDAAYGCGHWQLGVKGKVALGETHEIIDISGTQTITTPTGQVSHFTGGLLALPSNIGHFNHDEFAVVPEINVNVGYRFSKCLVAYVGYDFLYWSRVARPGDQIDRVIDTSQIPNFGQGTPTGIARPAVPFQQSDFWAHGLNVGVEFTW
jgi:hypothetical protein